MLSTLQISNEVVEAIQKEAEINAYLTDKIDGNSVENLILNINEIQSVHGVKLIDEKEAYERMADILGEDASILNYFSDNPFDAFIEIKLDLEKIDTIIEDLQQFDEIEYIRDNRQILNRIHDISEILKLIGYLVLFGVGTSTLVIISHIIRLGINNNKEQINTLRLLGAPEGFIALPYMMEGLVLTVAGGILAFVISRITINYLYIKMTGTLSFIPLPSQEEIVLNLIGVAMVFSVIVGMLGSVLGILSSKKLKH